MSDEIILKKLEQIKILLSELKSLLNRPFSVLEKDSVKLRAAERDFQLIVDLAVDINSQIIINLKEKLPDTYRQSFLILGKNRVLRAATAKKLAVSAQLRNILVHEYDFAEDYKKFYQSAKSFLPAYERYLKEIVKYINDKRINDKRW